MVSFGKRKGYKLSKEEVEESKEVHESDELIDLKYAVSADVKKQELHKLYLETQNYLLEQTNIISLVQRGLSKKEDVYEEIKRFLEPRGLNEDEISKMIDRFRSEIWGYGKLDELIHDKQISDIKILGPYVTRIKRLGQRCSSMVIFESNEEIRSYANLIATKNHTSLADISAIQSITDKTTSDDFILRINLASEYVNSVSNPYIAIRKIPKHKLKLSELIDAGMITEEEYEEIYSDIKKGASILLCGKGASGKTTMLNALIDEIPHTKSGLVIQESEELFSDTHPDLMFQKVVSNKGEGRINYSLKDLAINGLLTDIDYFVIGEIKGAEAVDFINASYTGSVCLCTVHSSSAMDAPNKLVHYMKYGSDYKKEECLEMLKDIDKIYFMKGFQLREMVEISGFNEELGKLEFNQLFKEHKRINKSCDKVLRKKVEYSK